jgi:hypothetical protein
MGNRTSVAVSTSEITLSKKMTKIDVTYEELIGKMRRGVKRAIVGVFNRATLSLIICSSLYILSVG